MRLKALEEKRLERRRIPDGGWRAAEAGAEATASQVPARPAGFQPAQGAGAAEVLNHWVEETPAEQVLARLQAELRRRDHAEGTALRAGVRQHPSAALPLHRRESPAEQLLGKLRAGLRRQDHAEGAALRAGERLRARNQEAPSGAAEQVEPELGGSAYDGTCTTLLDHLTAESSQEGAAATDETGSSAYDGTCTTLLDHLTAESSQEGAAAADETGGSAYDGTCTTLLDHLTAESSQEGAAATDETGSSAYDGTCTTLLDHLTAESSQEGAAAADETGGSAYDGTCTTLLDHLTAESSQEGAEREQAEKEGGRAHDAGPSESKLPSREQLADLRRRVVFRGHLRVPLNLREAMSNGWALMPVGKAGASNDGEWGVKYYYGQGGPSASGEQAAPEGVQAKDSRERFRLEISGGLLLWRGAAADSLQAGTPTQGKERAGVLARQYIELKGLPKNSVLTPEQAAEVRHLFPGQVDRLVSEGRFIYVMSGDGQFFGGPAVLKERHHSSFLAGGAVASAGELVIESGRLKLISNASGHYHPGPTYTWQALRQLQAQGVDLSDTEVELFDVPGKIPAPEFLDAFDPTMPDKKGDLMDPTYAMQRAKRHQKAYDRDGI